MLEQVGFAVASQSALSCIITAKGANSMTSVDTDSYVPSRLGCGFRSSSKTFGTPIIEKERLTRKFHPVGAKVESNFGVLYTKEDFLSALSVDGSVSGSYGGFSGSVKASFSDVYKRSQFSVTIALTKKVVTGIFQLEDFPVKEAAIKEAHDPLRFIRSFGDAMVKSVGMGGACCYLFRFVFSSETEAKNFKLSIKARYGSASGNYKREQKEKMERVSADIFFTGYTTGTFSVPNLFPADISDGTNYLFSQRFGGNMIAGLLEYFDNFQNHFKKGQVEDGYSECEIEEETLALLPEILPNQDKIADLGNQAEDIAEALLKQSEYLELSVAGLEYVQHVPDCNIVGAAEEAQILIEQSQNLLTAISERTEDLVEKSDLTSAYDLRQSFPEVPVHLCTVDPLTVQTTVQNPRGGWRYFPIEVSPADFGQTVWFEATARIGVVRHRPNGGTLRLRLLKHPLPTANSGLTLTADEMPDELVVEEDAHVSRAGPRNASIEVGGFSFIPAVEKCLYRVGVMTSGDYRGGSSTTFVVKISRQSESSTHLV